MIQISTQGYNKQVVTFVYTTLFESRPQTGHRPSTEMLSLRLLASPGIFAASN
jgi:hypothetical protein